ncbi:MAG: TIGR02281 family clan AA aspartic protease [Gammaproteobacteria bacterium]|nr:TIGR02281 family clan AA aspartic protease [Gammaproteobacteria bacterium]
MSDNKQAPTPEYSGKFALLMVLGLWIIVMVFGTLWAQRWFEARNAPSDPELAVGPDGRPEVILESDGRGHFLVNGSVNGETVGFLVDTGASSIAIPEPLAMRLGLESGYPVTTQTANGVSTAYTTIIDSVEIGGLELTNVRALIAPGLDGQVALLGMSFLRHFELVQKEGLLTIRMP